MENYTITKYQIEKLADENSIVKDCLKEWFPSAFKTEFKVGTVYKIDKNIFYCTEINECGDLYGYGLFNAKWGERFKNGSNICACNEVAAKYRLVEASTQEWESALINEAKNRGFIEGAKFKSTISEKGQIRTVTEKRNWDFYVSDNELNISTSQTEWDNFNTQLQSNPTIFKDGKWAEILPQEKTVITMENALKIIAKNMKVSPENIEIQS